MFLFLKSCHPHYHQHVEGRRVNGLGTGQNVEDGLGLGGQRVCLSSGCLGECPTRAHFVILYFIIVNYIPVNKTHYIEVSSLIFTHSLDLLQILAA